MVDILCSCLPLPCNQNRASLEEWLREPHLRLVTHSRQSSSPSVKVRLWLEKVFKEEQGSPHLSAAAASMGLSPQTLRRHLKKEGYSFQKLKEDARRDMAIHFINLRQHSVEEIAFKLGFSEASTFIRAFKKWTGVSPDQYRRGNFKPL